MQSIVEKSPPIELVAEQQFTSIEEDIPTKYFIKFEQIYLSKPTHYEKDGSGSPLMPNEARLRNLTYSSMLFAGQSLESDFPIFFVIFHNMLIVVELIANKIFQFIASYFAIPHSTVLNVDIDL